MTIDNPEEDKQHVLIIDDDTDLQAIMESVIRDIEGYNLDIKTAIDGGEARNAIRESHPMFDLILLDYLGLPDNGQKTLQLIREVSPESAVIAMTAAEDPDLERIALEQGAHYFLPKPFSNLKLASLVSVMLDKQLAGIDGLTKLLNKRQLLKKLAEQYRIMDRGNGPLSALMIDIDHFKEYNDTYGHLQGDQALRTIAQVLSRVRAGSIVGRYGGEEFLILEPRIGLEEATNGANRLSRDVRSTDIAGIAKGNIHNAHQEYVPGMTYHNVTVSIGVTCFPETTKDFTSLISDADKALYAAKGAGRNRVERYSFHG